MSINKKKRAKKKKTDESDSTQFVLEQIICMMEILTDSFVPLVILSVPQIIVELKNKKEKVLILLKKSSL
jgi:hypothetical protein